MDQNKLEKLREIEYTIQKTCILCCFSTFLSDEWGTCSCHKYEHVKHSGSVRLLSINKAGGCENFTLKRIHGLGKYDEFLK